MNEKAIAKWAAPVASALSRLDGQAGGSGGMGAFLDAAAAEISAIGALDWTALADDLAYEMALSAAMAVAEREEVAALRRAAMAAGDWDPISGAIEYIGRKTPIASKLRTAQWEAVPVELVERAQFSAGVESVRVVAAIQEKLMARVAQAREQLANGKQAFVDRSSFIGDLRRIAQEEGLDDGTQSLLNIASRRRLGLIYDFQMDSAAGYARSKTDTDADMMAVIPAWRLARVADRDQPRPDGFWQERWASAGERTGWDGAIRFPAIAWKTSRIWAALSRFGTPWPPFDFGSGIGVEDVEIAEAEAAGLRAPAAPQDAKPFNGGLEAAADPDMARFLERVFGDQVKIEDGRAQWHGAAIQDWARTAAAAPLKLGGPSAQTLQAARDAGLGVDLSQFTLEMPKAAQTAGDTLRYEMAPHAWRQPDAAEAAGGELRLAKRIGDQHVGIALDVSRPGRAVVRKVVLTMEDEA